MQQTKILIVEDSATIARLLVNSLTELGYCVVGPVSSAEQAIALTQRDSIDLVLMDIALPGEMNGIAAAERIRAEQGTPVVFLSGLSDDRWLQEAKKAAPYGYLVKPVKERELASTIEMALARASLDRQLQQSRLALKESEARYRNVLQNSPLGVMRSTLDGQLLTVNRAMLEIMGCQDEEEARNYYSDLAITFYTHPENRAQFLENILQLGAVENFEFQARKKNGESLWISINAKLSKDSTDDRGREVIDAYVMDITERKRNDLLKEFFSQPASSFQGSSFFRELARLLAQVLPIDFVCIDRLNGDSLSAHTLAVWSNGNFEDNTSYALLDTPCGEAVGKDVCCYPSEVRQLFPRDLVLQELNAESYAAVTLWSHCGEAIGLIAVIGTHAFTDPELIQNTLLFIAPRAAGELERVLAEEALKQSEGRFQAAMQASREGLFDWQLATNEIYYSPAWKTMLGYEPDELPDSFSVWEALTHPDDLKRFWKMLEEYLAGQRDRLDMEFRMRHKQGHWVDIHSRAQAVTDEQGLPVRIVGTHMDISARKASEEALKESEAKYRKLVQLLPDILMRFDHQGRHLFVSDKVVEVVDLRPAEFIGKTHRELGFPEDMCRYWEEKLDSVFATGQTVEEEFNFDSAKGKTIFNWRLIPEFGSGTEVETVLSLSRDVTGHRQAEQDYATLFQEMLDGFALHEIIVDGSGEPVDYRFVAVNPAFERLTGLKAEDIVGRTVMEVLPGTEAHWVKTYGQVALTGEPVNFCSYTRTLDKSFDVRAFSPMPGRFACIFMDVTITRKAEREAQLLRSQLQQAQKMEAIGTLAGGIAHDFNNILGGILGYAEMAAEDSPPGSDVGYYAEQITRAGERARDLIKQILAFSRQKPTERIAVFPQELIREVVDLLRSTLPSDISIEVNLEELDGVIQADPHQIHQVLMNICTNAYHAMEANGGTLAIRLEQKQVESGEALALSLVSGNYALISVQDTGCGISEEFWPRIFDPYFTTKEMGKGTGLGLSMVHGVVRECGGAVTFDSEKGKGSVFHVYLPLVLSAEIEQGGREGAVNAGWGHIMLVDDDAAYGNAIRLILEKMGYSVSYFDDAVRALHAFINQAADYDLVLTDQTMPHLGGLSLAQKMLAVRPEIPIVLSTGYSSKVDQETVEQSGVRALLMKPYKKNELAALLRSILQAGSQELQ